MDKYGTRGEERRSEEGGLMGGAVGRYRQEIRRKNKKVTEKTQEVERMKYRRGEKDEEKEREDGWSERG